MKIGFIGAGKVANAFGMYLIKSGLTVDYIHSKTKNAALAMAKLTDSSYCENVKTLVEKSDIVFITTSDLAIEEVSKLIANEFLGEKIKLKEKCFIHMSGALTSDELILLRDDGARCYSLHPLQSFANYEKALDELADTVFSLEGDPLCEEVNVLLRYMKNEIINLSKESKIKYHIAACISSNYIITLLNSSLELFEEIEIRRETAIKALMPLINGAVSNFQNFNCEDALTGPIKRGDYLTIKRHIDDLKDSSQKDLYAFMGQKTIPIAKKSGTDQINLDKIEKLLK